MFGTLLYPNYMPSFGKFVEAIFEICRQTQTYARTKPFGSQPGTEGLSMFLHLNSQLHAKFGEFLGAVFEIIHARRQTYTQTYHIYPFSFNQGENIFIEEILQITNITNNYLQVKVSIVSQKKLAKLATFDSNKILRDNKQSQKG